MLRFSHALLTSIAVSTLLACGAAPAPPPVQQASAPASDRLTRLVEQYWDETARINPQSLTRGAVARFEPAAGYDISAQYLADSLALERRYLDALLAIPRAGLISESQLTYDIFRRERELAVESFTYPFELLPVNPFRSMPLEFARTGLGLGPNAILSAKDYDSWQTRADGYARWTRQAIANMREGMRRGYTLPRGLLEQMLPALAMLGTDTPANPFYQPLRSIPSTLSDDERRRLADGITVGVKNEILPSYRDLHDFLRSEYLPRVRQSVGLSALPLGQAWYSYLIRRETASKLAPAEIHALGLSETERLRARLQSLLAEAGFAGNAQAFFEAAHREPSTALNTSEELLDSYAQLKAAASAAIPTLFAQAPQIDFVIRPVEAFRASSAPALAYERAANRSSPAVLYINTSERPLVPRTASFLRQALPGHHLQFATQEGRAGLPRFRRFGGDPGFVEGWGLYAESLGEELGLYRDTETKFASLSDQLACAAALVTDTGLNALGWNREQALDYLRAQVPIDAAEANSAIDREIALPGEALACAMGAHALRGLRAHAEQVLGPRFDVRDFHSELIDDGAMPLDILESAATLWLSGLH